MTGGAGEKSVSLLRRGVSKGPSGGGGFRTWQGVSGKENSEGQQSFGVLDYKALSY